MIPDFEKMMRDTMGQAKTGEMMPGFDKDAEWERLAAKLHTRRSLLPGAIWKYAAALLLIATGGTYLLTKSTVKVPAVKASAHNSAHSAGTAPHSQTTAAVKNNAGNGPGKLTAAVMPVKKHRIAHTLPCAPEAQPDKEVCNSTPYSIEICIVQLIKCDNGQPQAVATCSTLQPDQSGQLHYTAPEKAAGDCKVTVSEIHISRPETGEEILLTQSSTPITAQDMFNCITGSRKGDMLAGIFQADCKEDGNKQALRIANTYGSLILE